MKIKSTLFLLLLSFFLSAQNLQLHFDPRHALDKDIPATNYLTTTFEYFNSGKYGPFFFFIDLDYNQARGNIGTAYWEIYKEFEFKKSPIKAHFEYNGGVGKGFTIPNAYMIGPSYTYPITNGFLTTYILYKYNAFDKLSHDVQWTVVWNKNIWNKKISLRGFADLWSENKDRINGKGDKKIIFITEPQIWYNITEQLSLGTEIEISNRFYNNYSDKLHVFPTIAAKWEF